ncbi:hypothetical protein RZS08_35515, partial [Arthrospira platensis SPKY1]|nr:hypothetical protein [Arthrospira platensis SPKY1]
MQLPYAGLLWLAMGFLGCSLFLFRVVYGFGEPHQYRNRAYSAFTGLLMAGLLLYSVALNFQPLRMLLPRAFWQNADFLAVLAVGALGLFTLSNISRVVRS